jgi:hypothetical protein
MRRLVLTTLPAAHTLILIFRTKKLLLASLSKTTTTSRLVQMNRRNLPPARLALGKLLLSGMLEMA